MIDLNHPGQCVEHPLGILCRCAEYKEIANKFVPFTIGTQHPRKPKFGVEPFASAIIVWMPTRAERGVDTTKPIAYYCMDETEKVNETTVKKRWVPVLPELVSTKELRSNTSYLFETERHTQCTDMSALTDMLPHNGRVVRRKDIEWGIGSHKTAPEMTAELETKWPHVNGCFSTWADAFTQKMGCPPF